MSQTTLITGDSRHELKTLDPQYVQTVITSPPYFRLRNYGGGKNELGHERTPEQYIANLVEVFSQVKRILKHNGTLWLNLGDTYHNCSQLLIPARVAAALVKDGWILRREIVWHKPNPIPEGSAAYNRPTNSHEMVYLFSKRAKGYYFNPDPIREPHELDRPIRYLAKGFGGIERTIIAHPLGKNSRDVWTIPTEGKPNPNHPAKMPCELARRCLLAGSRRGNVVLDPFSGSGTTGYVALLHGRDYVGIDLVSKNTKIARKRLANVQELSKDEAPQPKKKHPRTRWKSKDQRHQEWRTPPDLFKDLDRIFRFTVDACADKRNKLCKRFWTQAQDCRVQDWSEEVVWCNPPWSDADTILPKAREARTAVFLLGSTTLTAKYLHENKPDAICHPSYRVQYVNDELPTSRPAQGSHLFIYNPTPWQIAQLKKLERWSVYYDPQWAA